MNKILKTSLKKWRISALQNFWINLVKNPNFLPQRGSPPYSLMLITQYVIGKQHW